MSGSDIRTSTVVAAADELLSGHFDAETVVLDFRSGVYYGVEGTGARIWQLGLTDLASFVPLASPSAIAVQEALGHP